MDTQRRNTQNDDKYVLEEHYVYVDLDTKLLDDQLLKSNTKIKLLGIDTENPIMQINNQLFKGNCGKYRIKLPKTYKHIVL